MEDIETVDKPLDGTPYLTYKAFKKIPSDLLITEETPEGSSIYAADFPKSFALILRKYHKPASPSFPSGGYTLWNPKLQVIYSCYLDAAMIHPKNKRKSRKKEKMSRKLSKFFE